MGLLLAEARQSIVPGTVAGGLRAVAVLRPGKGGDASAHEVATVRFAAARIAALLGLDYAQAGRRAAGNGGECYWLPLSTLSREQAAAAGILDESRLWGGVVPFAFVATKLVSHPLWRKDAAAPAGWKAVRGIEDCTLPGYSVFARQDAEEAGIHLLQAGDIRLKCAHARGGHGQVVIRGERQLAQWLDSAAGEAVADGLVVERHLVQSITYSIGSTRLPGHDIAYHGEQRNVVDRAGAEVYGGSVLTVWRGDFSTLCAELPEGEVAGAVRAAMRYDRLVRANYQVLASRRNYDVIAGVDSRGRRHLGVLEQSWRFGGASMAEVLAMERFAERPGLPWAIAETVESYGDGPLPPGAVEYWPGDAKSPRKYARIVRDGC
ncbi:DUF3182 family protein [Pseudoxanthomonas broegbernensis]|nr:DUF3182 family protein [Pseudoxanthomonas broegbernensis]MBB6064016.1 hypothetical protein [Pseudoxanthomonas broegbernensis]